MPLVSVTVGYAAIRYFGEEHMKDCIRVARSAQQDKNAPALPSVTMAGNNSPHGASPVAGKSNSQHRDWRN